MTLTANELSQIRTDYQAEILAGTCTILRPTYASDAMGAHTISWGTVNADIACRLGRAQKSGAAQPSAGQQVYPDGYILDVAHNQDIAENDRVVVGSETYDVVHVEDTSVQWIGLRSAHLRQRNG